MKKSLAILAVAGASLLMADANTANADIRFPSRGRSSSFSLSIGSGRGFSVGYSRGVGYRGYSRGVGYVPYGVSRYRSRPVYVAPSYRYGVGYGYVAPRAYTPVYVPSYGRGYDPYCW